MLKILGAVLVVASTTGIGISFSTDLKRRCMELRLLKQVIYMLRGEIKYTKTPLSEAFRHMAVRMSEPFRGFLDSLAEKMERMEGKAFGELWREEIEAELKRTKLTKEDREQLGALGDVLGYLDVEMQLASMELYLEQLELRIREAQTAIETKQKLYRSLGVAAGIFLVILLV